uniref:Retrotransposon protein, putative, LINE subclass n=1 Tax=Oryza sativa subsp. japonica TaxID=39947 RepID=Q2QVW5_ORYSJ|nr:retrotransposon protein, putative, LINE subclass [Oryza sativa Japonica Group]
MVTDVAAKKLATTAADCGACRDAFLYDAGDPHCALHLQQRAFPPRWRNWLGALLSTSTSQVVLIGILVHRIQHCRGLRLGNPLSTLLFILAFDPLQRILGKATELGVLTKLRGRMARLRTSMYVDDAIIFVNPPREDVIALKEIL